MKCVGHPDVFISTPADFELKIFRAHKSDDHVPGFPSVYAQQSRQTQLNMSKCMSVIVCMCAFRCRLTHRNSRYCTATHMSNQNQPQTVNRKYKKQKQRAKQVKANTLNTYDTPSRPQRAGRHRRACRRLHQPTHTHSCGSLSALAAAALLYLTISLLRRQSRLRPLNRRPGLYVRALFRREGRRRRSSTKGPPRSRPARTPTGPARRP